MTRQEAITEAKRRALELIEGDELGLAAAVFVDCLAKAKLDPPPHPNDVSHGIMLAVAQDAAGLRAWVETFQ